MGIDATQYNDALSVYQEQVYAMLEEMGIDPAEAGIDLFSADGEYDVDLLGDADLSPYFQLAVLQLAAIIAPDKINSDSGEITIENLPDVLGTELTHWLIDTVMENKELMLTSAGSDAEIAYLMNLIYSDDYESEYGDGSDDSSDDYVYEGSADAERINSAWDLGGAHSWFIDTQDAYNSGIMAVLARLDEVAQAKIAISQAMLDPEAAGTTLEQLEFDMESNMMTEQSLLNMMTQLQNGLTTVSETLSKLIESVLETEKRIGTAA